MSSPMVSVVMSTYNHAEFVAETIDSVLRQRDADFEFLIADDGSIDGTRDVVAAVHDKRMRFFPNESNRGACVVVNELIRRASGEFIALINSDDFWTDDDKLAFQVDVLRERPDLGACFGRVRMVDREGRGLDKDALPQGHVFDKENRSQGAWLRHFFVAGNCLCHPTMMIRRRCYDDVGLYDNRLRQIPDYDMWTRLIKRYNIHICEKEFIAFRQLPGENASSDTPGNIRRLLNETYFVLERFFDGASRALFLEGFHDLLTVEDPLDDAHVDVEQALLYLAKDRWAPQIYNLIGLERIHSLLHSEVHRPILADRYGIDDRTFHAMAADLGPFSTISPPSTLTSERGAALVAEMKRRALQRASRAARSASHRLRTGR